MERQEPGKAGPTKEGREPGESEKAPAGSSSSTEAQQTWKRKGQSGSGSQPGLLSPGKAKGCLLQYRPVCRPPETEGSGRLRAGLGLSPHPA